MTCVNAEKVTCTEDDIRNIVIIDYLLDNGKHVLEFHTPKDIHDTRMEIQILKNEIWGKRYE